jgi:hypothetical protein
MFGDKNKGITEVRVETSVSRLEKIDYDTFPNEASVDEVFRHYYELGFTNYIKEPLTAGQKALCTLWIVNGLVSNGGLYFLFMETQGKYNQGVLESLQLIRDQQSHQVFDLADQIYQRHQQWFDKQEIPPAFDTDHQEYQPSESEALNQLENQWYDLEGQRMNKLFEYLKVNKDELLKKEQKD